MQQQQPTPSTQQPNTSHATSQTGGQKWTQTDDFKEFIQQEPEFKVRKEANAKNVNSEKKRRAETTINRRRLRTDREKILWPE
jgi:hypothetical protein